MINEISIIASIIALFISGFTLGKYLGEFKVKIDLLWKIYVEEPLLKYSKRESKYVIDEKYLNLIPDHLKDLLKNNIKKFRKVKDDIYKLTFKLYKQYGNLIFDLAHRQGISGRDLLVLSALYLQKIDC